MHHVISAMLWVLMFVLVVLLIALHDGYLGRWLP